MNEKVAEWTKFFNKVFSEVKKKVLEQYSLEEDGSGPPEIIALREVVANFPCPMRILEIKVDTKKHTHIKDEVCQVIRYDYSKLGVAQGLVEYHGLIDAGDSEKLRETLTKSFGLSDKFFEEFYKDFTITGWGDDEIDFYTQFPLYNIKNNFRNFVSDYLVFAFQPLATKIRQKFGKSIDLASKFNLRPDSILPISEITKMDKTLDSLLPSAEGAGIEELQKNVSNLQLIPRVPEEAKRVFRRAKDLYIYGFFRYSFFTIAQHYAYLALESAIKNRYYQSFGKEVTLTNKKGETVKMGYMDHQKVIDFCRGRKSWDSYNLEINGEKFAFRTGELLDWLVRNEIINRWERKQCESGMRFRHLMSHLTYPSIFPPSYSVRALEFVADIINRLYL
jgi:hypothetical protein